MPPIPIHNPFATEEQREIFEGHLRERFPVADFEFVQEPPRRYQHPGWLLGGVERVPASPGRPGRIEMPRNFPVPVHEPSTPGWFSVPEASHRQSDDGDAPDSRHEGNGRDEQWVTNTTGPPSAYDRVYEEIGGPRRTVSQPPSVANLNTWGLLRSARQEESEETVVNGAPVPHLYRPEIRRSPGLFGRLPSAPVADNAETGGAIRAFDNSPMTFGRPLGRGPWGASNGHVDRGAFGWLADYPTADGAPDQRSLPAPDWGQGLETTDTRPRGFERTYDGSRMARPPFRGGMPLPPRYEDVQQQNFNPSVLNSRHPWPATQQMPGSHNQVSTGIAEPSVEEYTREIVMEDGGRLLIRVRITRDGPVMGVDESVDVGANEGSSRSETPEWA